MLGAAVVVDGGYAFAQRRSTQNAADFAAMAGTRIVGEKLSGNPPGAGTAANVRAAIDSVLDAHGSELVSATYIDEHGLDLGDVSTLTSIPADARGVVVNARTNWRPFLLGVIGVVDWQAGSTATAKTYGQSGSTGVMPVGIQEDTFAGLPQCPIDDVANCADDAHLTPGSVMDPGNFGWLSFGIGGDGNKHCAWANSLGMTGDPSVDGDSCLMNQEYLQSQIGPVPPPDSHGCCTAVGLEGPDLISGLTGNTWGDISWYIDNKIPVWIPIYDTTTGASGMGAGSHDAYHIVGFAAIIFTDTAKPHDGSEHAKWLEGAMIANACGESNPQVEGKLYCSAPGDPFVLGETGAVQLVR